jgi:hypothetical protein
MSVESWPQGQSNQRQRTIIASGTANPPLNASLFMEPGGTAAPPKGAPPDASNKKPGKPTGAKPTDQTTPASNPGGKE